MSFLNARESEIESGVAERKPSMVQAHQVQDGGMKIMNVKRLIHGPHSDFITGTMHDALFDARASHELKAQG